MKPASPTTANRTPRRLLLLALLIAAVVAAALGIAKLFPRAPESGLVAQVEVDSSSARLWKKTNPWLYDRPEYEPFREPLILPLTQEQGLGPRSVRRRGTTVEVTFPAGRPLHEYAYALEVLCARAGIAVVEGREATPEQFEYQLKDAQARPLAVRLVLGKAALPGAVRMALVITGLGRASEADLAAWVRFSEAVTLVFPDTAASLARGFGDAAPEIFIELPMEPASYPYVKPGPRALFIDYSREQAEGILGERLDRYPKARGFATTHGDRAIENPQLMESVLDFMASRSLVFLDLTGSPLSQTAALSVKSGAESFTARVQDAGPEKTLEAELDRRLALAKKAGEGIWVLRYGPGLPAALTRLFARRGDVFGELGLQWVPLADLRREGK
jgi:polysaccharide deacetylase 2 family uncharacterized protein YibQ